MNFLQQLKYIVHNVQENSVNMVICEGCKKHLLDRIIHVVLMLFVFVCAQQCPTHIVLWVFLAINRLMYPMLPNFLVCLFLIIPLVFSNVYLVWIVIYCVVFCISLFCHQFIQFLLRQNTTTFLSSYLCNVSSPQVLI